MISRIKTYSHYIQYNKIQLYFYSKSQSRHFAQKGHDLSGLVGGWKSQIEKNDKQKSRELHVGNTDGQRGGKSTGLLRGTYS